MPRTIATLGSESALHVDSYTGYNPSLRRDGTIEAECVAPAQRGFIERGRRLNPRYTETAITEITRQ